MQIFKGELFRRKSIASVLQQVQREENADGDLVSLKRTLGTWNLTSIGIGGIIGAGLFSLTGLVAANYAGPAVTISFLIAGIVSALAALCYAEFSSMVPVAGSAYTYSYVSFGEFVAWLIGWDLVLEYGVCVITVAISWSAYFQKFMLLFGINLPVEFMLSPFESAEINGVVHHGIVNIPAMFIVILLSALLMRGTHKSAMVNNLIVLIKLAVVFLFIILGWSYINPENYTNYIPENTGTYGEYGWSGIFRGAAIIFFAYIGFDTVSVAAQEAKDPQRTVPRGILYSLIICTGLYLLFAHVMTGIAHYDLFKGHDGIAPVAIAVDQMPNTYEWLNKALIIAIMFGYASVILVMLYGQARIFYSMGRDGLLPKMFCEVHKKFRTTWKSNALTGIVVALMAGFIPASVAAELTSIGTLFAFVLVAIGIIILRKTDPDAERKFRAPFVPVVPILCTLACLWLMISLPLDTWIRFVVWLLVGMVIYFTYSRKASRLANTGNQ